MPNALDPNDPSWHDKSELPAVVELLSNLPLTFWVGDTRLKYVNIHIDTRDGHFILQDRKGERIGLDVIQAAIDSAKERLQR